MIATAIGLFAGSAVIAYNRYSAQVEIIMNRFEAFTEEFSILSRIAKRFDYACAYVKAGIRNKRCPIYRCDACLARYFHGHSSANDAGYKGRIT